MRAIVSLLVAVCGAVIASILLGFALGGLGAASAQVSLILGAALGLFAWFSIPRDAIPALESPRGWIAWSVVVIFALFALRAFCWVIFFRYGEIGYLSVNNIGDLPLHVTFIRYFANGAPFWPDNPIFAAVPLRYPFGVDLFNSLLLLVGVDLIRGLVWAGLIGALATGVMLWRWGGAFAIAGFLFNGGFAAWKIFQEGYGGDLQSEIAWKSIPLALFVTQRGLLYAIPVGLALLWSWRARFFRDERGLPFWIEVLLYSTLPIFHLHTFLFLSAMLGGWLILSGCSGCGPFRSVELRGKIVRLVTYSVLPATLLVSVLTGGFRGANAIHLKPGWMQGAQNPFVFWGENFGLLPLLVVALLVWLWRKRDDLRERTEQFAFVIPAVALFLVCCFVMFAPWEWDNTKLFLWSYLAILPALWAMLRKAWPWLRWAICFTLFFAGFISLIEGLGLPRHSLTMAQRSIVDGMEAPLHALPVTATFACFPTYDHPLLLLGRKVVAAYDGHLSSHGIRYEETKGQLEELLRGKPGWEERVRKLGVDYLFWGQQEEKEYGPSLAPWAGKAELVAQGEWGRIYDLRPFKEKPLEP